MTKFSTSTLKSFIIFAICIITLSGCKTEEVDVIPYAAITVVNASPTSATYDAYLNDTKLNSAALPLGGGVSYRQQIAGTYNLKFTIAGRAESILAQNVNLSANTYHSFYLLGSANAFEGVFATDDLSGTSTTNAFVRFINLSPDAPALSLAIADGEAVGSGQSYKGIGTFAQVAAGTKSLELKDASGTVRATLTDVNLVANGYYTIIARGLVTPVNSTDVAFGAQVIITK